MNGILAGCGKTLSAHENFDSPPVWHERTPPQDAQKGCPARPQRVKARGVPSGYVEGLNDARTKLADFFSILLSVHQSGQHAQQSPERVSGMRQDLSARGSGIDLRNLTTRYIPPLAGLEVAQHNRPDRNPHKP